MSVLDYDIPTTHLFYHLYYLGIYFQRIHATNNRSGFKILFAICHLRRH